ncbi:hypothetical protein D3C77_411290 [compost metagenome]
MRLMQWLLGKMNIRRYEKELEYKEHLYEEVKKAQREWEQAWCAFQEAVGSDEVDIAIYILEAAERRYQVQLKAAKQAQVTWEPFQLESQFRTSYRK